MAKIKWDASQIPDQTGRVFVITGANTGLGKENARVLAAKNASVIIAARSKEKAQQAADDIREDIPSADLSVRVLDLASLASVSAFAERLMEDYDRLDVLINNAGVMMCPYSKTEDGFEIQFGTNHLGHFALSLRLLPLLRKTPESRIVILSSLAHRGGKLDFDDLNWDSRKYKTGTAYCDSKLANYFFGRELSKKLKNEGNHPLVTIAHPGMTQTDLMRHSRPSALFSKYFAQEVEIGALPALRAAFDDNASPGDYYGPGGLFGLRGHPVKVKPAAVALNESASQHLWRLSEEMTGVAYPE